jgi:hypothetical protein
MNGLKVEVAYSRRVQTYTSVDTLFILNNGFILKSVEGLEMWLLYNLHVLR